MDLETRVANLENLVAALIDMMDNNKYYTDADIAGVRQEVNEVTPYTETKKAYYGEKEKIFYNVPNGFISVFFDNESYKVERIGSMVKISFSELKNETDITISVQ